MCVFLDSCVSVWVLISQWGLVSAVHIGQGGGGEWVCDCDECVLGGRASVCMSCVSNEWEHACCMHPSQKTLKSKAILLGDCRRGRHVPLDQVALQLRHLRAFHFPQNPRRQFSFQESIRSSVVSTEHKPTLLGWCQMPEFHAGFTVSSSDTDASSPQALRKPMHPGTGTSAMPIQRAMSAKIS